MKTVVFGGSGFLGSHVADALSAHGHSVTIFDLKPAPYASGTQQVVIGDILDRAAVAKVVRKADVVYHLAGIVDLDDATTKPLETVQQNIAGTVILLAEAAQAGVKRFVYASTVYVHSQLGGFYRCSKQAAELYIEEYERRAGLDYTILRYGTLYGPRADSRNSVHRYLQQALREKTIRFPGTGEEMREYIHVRDAARLSVEILVPVYRNQPIIITGPYPMKARDMLGMIQEILDRSIRIEYAEPLNDAHYTRTPYAFTPRIGNKLIGTSCVDMGQGLLECLHELAAATTLPTRAARARAGTLRGRTKALTE